MVLKLLSCLESSYLSITNKFKSFSSVKSYRIEKIDLDDKNYINIQYAYDNLDETIRDEVL